MAELKTKLTGQKAEDFLNSIADEKKRKDSFAILEMMKKITKEKPKMWGTSIIGYGSYHYKSESGQEGDWPLIGFSPRKQALTLYIIPGFTKFDNLLKKLGKFKTSKGCLYIKKLDDVNVDVLKKLIEGSYFLMKKTYKKNV